MSKLSNIQTMCEFCGNAPGIDKTCQERIKALIAEICQECDASPKYKKILEEL